MHVYRDVRFLDLLRPNGGTNVLKFLQWIQGVFKISQWGILYVMQHFHNLFRACTWKKIWREKRILGPLGVTCISNKVNKVVISRKLQSLENQSRRGLIWLMLPGCFWWVAGDCPAHSDWTPILYRAGLLSSTFSCNGSMFLLHPFDYLFLYLLGKARRQIWNWDIG